MTTMFTRPPALALGALIGLSLLWSAGAPAGAGTLPRRGAPGVETAQYAAPPFDGPGGYDAPDEAYGPPPGMNGPGYGGGPDYGEDRPRRRHAGPAQGGGGQHVTYHGFHIDLSDSGGSRNLTGQIASMEHQIDLVDGVGLGVANLGLFRGVPIKLTSGLRGGGHYDGGPAVLMGSLKASDRRPVLLHEYMHVYHTRLPGGFHNPEIEAFYQDAVSRGLYPAGSYMLKDRAEFFAMTASCYLYGTVARPPYDRAAIRARQPDYYAYLGRLFGPPHGSHSAGPRMSDGRGRGGPPREDAAY